MMEHTHARTRCSNPIHSHIHQLTNRHEALMRRRATEFVPQAPQPKEVGLHTTKPALIRDQLPPFRRLNFEQDHMSEADTDYHPEDNEDTRSTAASVASPRLAAVSNFNMKDYLRSED